MKKFIKLIVADKVLMGLTVLLLLITGVSGSLLIVRASEHLFGSKSITAIDFSSLTRAEITEWYETNFDTLNGLVFDEVYDEEIAEGTVIDQDPKAGEKVTVDSGLTITISLGQDPDAEFELPDFVGEGYTLDMVEEWFTENGFTNVSYEYVVDEDSEAYTVIAINKTGTVKRSEELLVTISVGDAAELIEVEVPDFSTMTVDEIKSWANTYLINVDIEYVFSTTYAQGTIIDQSVDSGTTVNGGSTITITVSRGEGITIASLSGYTLSQARTYASDNGLVLSIRYTYSSTVSEGLVVSTSPSSGSMLGEGDTLTVYISLGADPSTVTVTVEDYSGKTEAALKSYLDGLGISYSKQTSIYSDDVAAGLVAYNTTGQMKLTSTVQYALSLGAYVIDTDDFDGKTLTDAQSLVSSVNALGAGISLQYTEVATSSYTAGTLYGCSVSTDGKSIACNLAKASTTAYIYNIPSYYLANNGTISVEASTASVEYALGAFENLTIVTEESTYKAGTILSISVNGSTTFDSGRYDTATTEVVVTISKGMN